MHKVLVTGSAGFIGYHLSQLLLDHGHQVVGFDGMTDYYEVALKQRRHQMLLQNPGFSCVEARLEEPGKVWDLAMDARPNIIVHLAAQAGVRYSFEAPGEYVTTNINGSFAVMEAAKELKVDHLLMASTSSVYGANTQMPFAETHKTVTPTTIYAATKLANEAMTHSYAHLYDLPTTMFRFFTVYGPWGRPDMALFLFTKGILEGTPIKVFGHGNLYRDFTYVGDLVEGIRRLIDVPPQRPDSLDDIAEGDSLSPVAPHRVVNIGNNDKVRLADFIDAIEQKIGKPAQKIMMDIQPGEVEATWADASLLKKLTNYAPSTDIRTGVEHFVDWYRDYYQT